MEQPCPNCGSVVADGGVCACPVPGGPGHDAAPEDKYSPPMLWHLIGIAGWVLTVGAVIQPSGSSAALSGELTGMLLVPVALRVVYVMELARGPRVWSRALFSPWVWAIAIVINVMAMSNHPR